MNAWAQPLTGIKKAAQQDPIGSRTSAPSARVATSSTKVVTHAQKQATRRTSKPAGSSGAKIFYRIRFKKPRTEVFVCDDGLEFLIGDMVMVEADRGEDLGEVIDMQSEDDVNAWLARSSLAKVGRRNGRPGPTGGMQASLARQKFKKKILRLANQEDVDQLPRKDADEATALTLCKAKVKQAKLPIELAGAEYQFDRRRLTFYFRAETRIDFRALVRDLFAVFKTRIWMQQLSTKGKGGTGE